MFTNLAIESSVGEMWLQQSIIGIVLPSAILTMIPLHSSCCYGG